MSFGGETCAGRWEITYGLGSSWEWLPCERFRRGKCDGRDCRYSHAEDVMKRRMNLCSYVAKNKNCPNKDQCRDSHDKSAHPCYGYHGYAKCPPESRCELSHSPLEESWQRKDFTKFYFDKLAYKLRKERENGKTPTFWWTGLVDAETARRAAVKDGFAKYIEQRGTGGNRKRQSESGGEGKNPSETSRKVPRHQKAPSSEAHHQIQMTWHDLHAKNDRGVACSAPNLENLAPLIQKTPGMQREEDTSPVPDTSQDDTGPRRERAEGRQVAPQMSSYASGKGGHTGPCFDFQAFGACSKRNDSPDSHQQMCISEALDFVHKHAPQLSKLIEEAPQDHTNRWWYGLLKFNKRTPNPDLDEAAERGYRALHPRPPSQSLYSTLRPQFNNPRPAGANLHLNSVPNPPPPPQHCAPPPPPQHCAPPPPQHCAPPPPPQHCAPPPPPQHCAPPPPPQHCVPPPPPQHCAQPPLPPHYAPPPLPPHYAPPPFSQPRAPPPFPQHRAPPPLPQHRAPPPFPQHCAPPPDELSSRPNFFVGYFGPQGVFVDQSVAHVGPSLNRVRPKAGHHAAALDAVTGGGYYTAPPARHLPERRTEIGYGTHAAVPAGPFMHGAQQDGVQRPRLGQRDQR